MGKIRVFGGVGVVLGLGMWICELGGGCFLERVFDGVILGRCGIVGNWGGE